MQAVPIEIGAAARHRLLRCSPQHGGPAGACATATPSQRGSACRLHMSSARPARPQRSWRAISHVGDSSASCITYHAADPLASPAAAHASKPCSCFEGCEISRPSDLPPSARKFLKRPSTADPHEIPPHSSLRTHSLTAGSHVKGCTGCSANHTSSADQHGEDSPQAQARNCSQCTLGLGPPGMARSLSARSPQ
jgi:hypothetical protein